MKKKLLALILSVAVVASIAAAGTLAYLTSTSDVVTNTFTVGDINIDLKEHEYKDGVLTETEVTKNEYTRILPGQTLPKDPFVTVKADSEDCWLYVVVANGMNNVVKGAATLDINENWELIEGDDVLGFYRYKLAVDSASTDQIFKVFDNMTINADLTNAEMADINEQAIVINAFAHQVEGVEQSVADAAAIETLLGAFEGTEF